MFLNPIVQLDQDAGFAATDWGRFLAERPVGIVDIGARDGIHDLFFPLGKLGRVLGFEPDEQGYADVVEKALYWDRFADVIMRMEALGDGSELPFYVLSKPTNNSLLAPNPVLVDRYKMDFFRYRSEGRTPTRRLDDVLAEPGLDGFGELIKIDTQGSEHLIFQHARQTLRTTTVGLVAEVWFCEIYKNQPLFHDICALLAPLGLRFYGFTSLFLRSGKRIDKRHHLGRERLLYGDALFIKDVLDEAAPSPTERHVAVQFVFAVLNGYFDLAQELAETFGGPDRDKLRAVIGRMSASDNAAILSSAASAVSQAESEPDRSNVIIGHFVDKWRSYYDFGDQA